MKNSRIQANRRFFFFIAFALTYLINSPQATGQETTTGPENKGKIVLMGSFGFNSYKYAYEYYGDIEEEQGIKTFINPRFGFFAGKNLIIGLGIGFSFLENYPQKTITYDSWNTEDGGEIETFITSRKDLRSSVFLRFQNKLSKKMDYYIDLQAGMDFNLHYKRRSSSYYGSTVYVGNVFFSQLSSGVILNLNKTLALQSEIISLGYRAEFKKDDSKPYSTLNIEYLFSNPNIGLVFYF